MKELKAIGELKTDLFEEMGKIFKPTQMDDKLTDLADFLSDQMEKLNLPTQKTGKYQDEVLAELNKIIESTPFDVEHFNGGNAIIDVTDYWFKIKQGRLVFDCILNGTIKYVVINYCLYPDVPNEYDLIGGFYDGNYHISYQEDEVESEEVLISLDY
jgi:hypothetical protein